MPNQTTSTSAATTERAKLKKSQATLTEPQPSQDLSEHLKAYARERPEVAALWCVGIGFILGWKLKPW